MSAIQNRLKRLENDNGDSSGKVPRRVISLVGPNPDDPIAIMCIEVNGVAKSKFLTPSSFSSTADLLSAADSAHLDIHGKPWPSAEMEDLKARC